MPSVVDEPIYKPHEARIHESVFDTLSQPLLSRANGNSTDNISHGRNSPSVSEKDEISFRPKFALSPPII